MHSVIALILPQVVAFDLAIPAQVFGHPDEGDRYCFEVCTPVPVWCPPPPGLRCRSCGAWMHSPTPTRSWCPATPPMTSQPQK